MTHQMTPEEFVQKCDYEGGYSEAILGYGLSGMDLDDSDPEFKKAVGEFHAVAGPLLGRVEALAEGYRDPE